MDAEQHKAAGNDAFRRRVSVGTPARCLPAAIQRCRDAPKCCITTLPAGV
jgi:hypothetical protein